MPGTFNTNQFVPIGIFATWLCAVCFILMAIPIKPSSFQLYSKPKEKSIATCTIIGSKIGISVPCLKK